MDLNVLMDYTKSESNGYAIKCIGTVFKQIKENAKLCKAISIENNNNLKFKCLQKL